METVHAIAELRACVARWRRADEHIALVPTMGNLHRGHLRLVEEARRLATRTVVSIFVNPLQFGPHEDFAGYPRTLAEDSRQLAGFGVDLLFAPPTGEVYPRPLESMTQVEVPGLSTILCGAYRPGHFRGMATVVTKLLAMVQPDVGIFGEKDWQQLVIIRRLVADLNLPVAVVGVPTVREADGLAMSSRNGYLTPAERAVAPNLYRALTAVADGIRAGERRYRVLEDSALALLEQVGFRPDYVTVRRADDLEPPTADATELRVLAAAWLGRARLIDNVAVSVPEGAARRI